MTECTPHVQVQNRSFLSNYKKIIQEQAKQVFAGNGQRLLQLHSWELLEVTTLHLISFTAEIIWLVFLKK